MSFKISNNKETKLKISYRYNFNVILPICNISFNDSETLARKQVNRINS